MALQGTGTQADPYLIGTLADLQEYTSDSSYRTNKFTKLMCDIDLSSITWVISDLTDGGFDGNGNTISNLTISKSGTDYVGFFGVSSGSKIKNLRLLNVTISGNTKTGALCGFLIQSTVSKCSATGSVTALNWVGGLVGDTNYVTFTDCYSSVNVNTQGGAYGGSLAGDLSDGTLVRCYSSSVVTSPSSIMGSGGSATNSFYDYTINGLRTSGVGTPKTTAEMKTQSTFVGWDFVNDWTIIEGQTYPELRVFYAPLQISIAPSYQKVAQGQNAEITSTVTGG